MIFSWDVPHAQNAAGHPVWLEGFQTIQLFTGAQKLDGHTGHFTDAERSTAARISVDLCHNQARGGDPGVEALGHMYGLLAGHGVHHQQNIGGARNQPHLFQLLHHCVVDL